MDFSDFNFCDAVCNAGITEDLLLILIDEEYEVEELLGLFLQVVAVYCSVLVPPPITIIPLLVRFGHVGKTLEVA